MTRIGPSVTSPPMSAWGQKRTSRDIAIYVRFRGQSRHPKGTVGISRSECPLLAAKRTFASSPLNVCLQPEADIRHPAHIRINADRPGNRDGPEGASSRQPPESRGGFRRELPGSVQSDPQTTVDFRFDLVAISEFPDDATAATFVLRLGALGNVRTTTVKAFPENAYRKIVEAV